jgi:rhodanese-related sulfurtransferase
MSVAAGTVRKTDVQKVLKRARARGKAALERFAGTVDPVEAWQLVHAGEAVLVDVRTEEELNFVGRVPEAIHVPWVTWPGMRPNRDFLSSLENEIPSKATPILFLCRSGQRSAAAAAAASEAGYKHAFNIAEGFEGALDEAHHRGAHGGWRHHGLPWVQN